MKTSKTVKYCKRNFIKIKTDLHNLKNSNASIDYHSNLYIHLLFLYEVCKTLLTTASITMRIVVSNSFTTPVAADIWILVTARVQGKTRAQVLVIEEASPRVPS